MLRPKSLNYPHRVAAMAGLLVVLCAAGCGVSQNASEPGTTTSSTTGLQNYLAPYVLGTIDNNDRPAKLSTFTFDSTASAFSQTTYLPQTGLPGGQLLNAGKFSAGQRGLLNLNLYTTYLYSSSGGTGGSGSYQTTNFPCPSSSAGTICPMAGSYAVELADKSGGFVQIRANGDEQDVNEPAAPMVAASSCPSSSTAQTYLFVTIPDAIPPTGGSGSSGTWDPTQETAYGSVDISASGSTVNLANIRQFTLPSAGGSGAPAQPAAASLSGICGATYYGNTIEVPGQVTITNPGTTGATYTTQATIGIGASGLLVEDNDSGTVTAAAGSTEAPLTYENALGAGTGAVGLPKSSAAVDTGAVVGAQYLGFIYSPGVYSSDPLATNWSSHLASFGFSTVPSGCSSIAPKTSTLIYGGSFTNDDPTTSSDGFGNCNFAVDLGAQDATTNGLYPQATVWVAATYPANATGATYSFPAVAIAGQLNGKYAIFLIGVDSAEPWAIYLLQSN